MRSVSCGTSVRDFAANVPKINFEFPLDAERVIPIITFPPTNTMNDPVIITSATLFLLGLTLGVSITIAVIATKAWRDAKEELSWANLRVKRLTETK